MKSTAEEQFERLEKEVERAGNSFTLNEVQQRLRVCWSAATMVAKRWIPISESLPEAGERVLIFDADSDICIVAIYRDGLSEFESVETGDYYFPTHWQSIPYFLGETHEKSND